MNKKRLFNDEWEFVKLPIGSGISDLESVDTAFTAVDIPHDWLIDQAQNLYESSVGWYRKIWAYKKSESSDLLIILEFEGVYMDSEIYVNGEQIFHWENGYSSFEVELTAYLKEGENEILVRVNHQSPNSRWYSGAGIYRNIWLHTYPATHIVPHGIYISTTKAEDGWIAEVETQIQLNQNTVLQQTIVETHTGRIAAPTQSLFLTAEKEIEKVGNQQFFLKDVQVWDLETPTLYQLRTELLQSGNVICREETSFGFRTIEFLPDRGFWLNGRRCKLNGVCEHHDLGCLGSAYHQAAMRRKIRLLKEMGVNAIRTAHNMPAPGLMELADEMGMLIQSESFDMWERSKTTFDYARFFKTCYEKDVAVWVRRDRNHPSLMMWSIGNEIFDTHVDSHGAEITQNLMEAVRKHDPRGNAAVTLGSNYMPWEHARECADIVKLAGYNYSEQYYEAHHREHPDWIIYGSETASIVQSRGIYHFPFARSVLADEDLQCSALGNSTTS
ncbi:MAG: glycoside hydrolase family 2 TIM barrel-domain containing protein, partial [Hungatella sp.]